MRLEGTLQVTRMIVDLKLPLDQGGNALQSPARGGKARRHRAAVQEPTQTAPGPLIEPGRSSRDRPGLQSAPTLLSQRGSPTGDTGATDPKLPGDLRLGEPPLAHQRRRRQTALLHLLRR